MKIVIHKGSREIGGTCIELTENGATLLLDLGQSLKKDSLTTSLEGVHPDALLISHPHQDHYGLMELLEKDVPVFIGGLGKSLIDASLIFRNKALLQNNFISIEPHKTFKIEQFIEVTPYLVDHSSPESFAFLIEIGFKVGKKRIFYSGDFRAHGRKSVLFKRLIASPPPDIDILFMEGTMLHRDNQDFPTEKAVEEKILEVIKRQKNISFLICSSQNIDRIVSAYRACKRAGKTLVIDVYTAWILEQMKAVSKHTPRIDWKDRIRVYVPGRQYSILTKYPSVFGDFTRRIFNHRIKDEELMASPKDFLYISKISQSKEVEKYLDTKPVNIIYSQWLGYLEEKKPSEGVKAFNKLKHDPRVKFVYAHTSGHATLKDLKSFVKAINPKVLIPIHTEHRDEYEKHFDNVKVLDDKQEFLYLTADEEFLNANKVLLDKLTAIFDDVDPMNLIFQAVYAGFSYEGMKGEYDLEAQTILLRLSEWTSIEELERVVAEEFANWFYLHGEDDYRYFRLYYKKAAQLIWNARRKELGMPPEDFEEIELPERKPPVLIKVD